MDVEPFRRSPVTAVAGVSVALALITLVALVWLGLAAPAGTHPFFYFALILFGGGALSLLIAGGGGFSAGSRLSTGQLSRTSAAGIRRLVVAMWLCALVADALGVLVLLAISNGRGNTTPISGGALTAAFVAVGATVIFGAVTASATRLMLRPV